MSAANKDYFRSLYQDDDTLLAEDGFSKIPQTKGGEALKARWLFVASLLDP